MADIEKEKMLAPKLRFKGFNYSWESKKIGEAINNKSAKYNPEKDKKSFKCIELEHLSSNTGELLGYIDSINSSSIKNKFERGEVLFGKLRPYLRKYLEAPFEGVCSSEIWVLKGGNIFNGFLYNIIQTDYFIDLANQSTGSKMPRADWNVVSSGFIHFPTLLEQQKIASFLSAVDEKIQQLTRKKELLEQYKKGVMQQLFSGKLRFKDENGKAFPKWEERFLGEIFYCAKGNGLSKDKLVADGKYKCILYGQLYTTYNEVISAVSSRTNYKEGELSNLGDLLVPCSTTTTGIDLANVTALNIENVLLGGDITILRTKEKVDNIFYAYYLSNFKKNKIASYAQGSTIVHLSYNHLKLIKIDFPCFEEQNLIGNFIINIQIKIENLHKQITQTQTFKKGLLQQMFV